MKKSNLSYVGFDFSPGKAIAKAFGFVGSNVTISLHSVAWQTKVDVFFFLITGSIPHNPFGNVLHQGLQADDFLFEFLEGHVF